VLRLKGGDPSVFGRAGEELDYLKERGVEVSVVPGITSASGVAATLGFPLTHRDYADGVRLITGQSRADCTLPLDKRHNWPQLADAKTTLVIYMGLTKLPFMAKNLISAGLAADTPAVAVQEGTTPSQRVVAAPLSELPAAVQLAELKSPTLLVIGGVVSLLDPCAVDAAVKAASGPSAANRVWQAEELLKAMEPVKT